MDYQAIFKRYELKYLLSKEQKEIILNAMKPYMAAKRADSVDRAIKMANMAKVAKSALGMLGR